MAARRNPQDSTSDESPRQDSTIEVRTSLVTLPGTVLVQESLQLPTNPVNSTLTLNGPIITVSLATPAQTKPSASENPNETNGSDKKVSPAEAAGIGIGAALGVLLLTSAVFLFLRHYRFRKPGKIEATSERPPRHHRGTMGNSDDHDPPYATSHLRNLPEQLGDDHYIRRMVDFREKIKSIVDNYLLDGEYLQISVGVETRLQLLAPRPDSGSSWATALLDRNHRRSATRLLVARILFGGIGHGSQIDIPLLPSQLLYMHSAIQEGIRRAGNRNDRIDHEENLDIWRQISGGYISPEMVTRHAGSMVDRLATELAPLLPDQHRRRDGFRRSLERLARDTAILGLELLKSPHEAIILWGSEGLSEQVVIYPGLEFVRLGGRGSSNSGKVVRRVLDVITDEDK